MSCFGLRKIAEWYPDWHHMSVESLRCCQNMAKTFLRYKDVTNEENVITGYLWGSNEEKKEPVGENGIYQEWRRIGLIEYEGGVNG